LLSGSKHDEHDSQYPINAAPGVVRVVQPMPWISAAISNFHDHSVDKIILANGIQPQGTWNRKVGYPVGRVGL
jgi:hypothetical protein